MALAFFHSSLALEALYFRLSPFFSSFYTYSGTSGEVKSVAGVFVLL